MLAEVLEGFNFTCFAYGMTGAGKTHTMMGDLYQMSTGEPGICFMTVAALFQLIEANSAPERSHEVKISYLEIYNEQAVDLLVPNSGNLMIVEDPVKGVFVPGLEEKVVHTSEDLMDLIMEGND